MVHHHDIPKQPLGLISTRIIGVPRAAVIAFRSIDIGIVIGSHVRAPAVFALENTKRIVVCTLLATTTD